MTDLKTLLRPGMRGVAVEGDDDKRIIEAFLDAGTRAGLWGNWSISVRVEKAGNFNQVLKEISDPANAGTVWGIVDRDWRSDNEIVDLQATYRQLIFLARIMIENYLIDPNELLDLLPTAQRSGMDVGKFRSEIEAHLDEGTKHGALSQMLYDSGAYDFCRGNTGYPRGLVSSFVTDETEITVALEKWRQKLHPSTILPDFQQHVASFLSRTRQEQVRLCIHGKVFFNQVIVQRVLNTMFGQAKREIWLNRLLQSPNNVPPDLQPILRQLIP